MLLYYSSNNIRSVPKKLWPNKVILNVTHDLKKLLNLLLYTSLKEGTICLCMPSVEDSSDYQAVFIGIWLDQWNNKNSQYTLY